MTDQTTPVPGATDIEVSRAALRRNWGWLLALGIVLVIGGVLALLAPVLASLAVEAMVGAAFLVGGVMQGLHAWRAEGWRPRLFGAVSAIIYVVGAVLILLNPLAGLVALTLVVLAVFLVDGVVRIALGAAMRPEEGWLWVIVGGVVSVVVALFLFAMFPEVSFLLLGILAAAALIMEGIGFVMVALAARRAARGEGALGEELRA